MCLAISREFKALENWLALLITTYKNNPSQGLAKTIYYYVNEIVHHDDLTLSGEKHCQYLSMQRFWQWYTGEFSST